MEVSNGMVKSRGRVGRISQRRCFISIMYLKIVYSKKRIIIIRYIKIIRLHVSHETSCADS